MKAAGTCPPSSLVQWTSVISRDHLSKVFRVNLRRSRRRSSQMGEQYGHLAPLGRVVGAARPQVRWPGDPGAGFQQPAHMRDEGSRDLSAFQPRPMDLADLFRNFLIVLASVIDNHRDEESPSRADQV